MNTFNRLKKTKTFRADKNVSERKRIVSLRRDENYRRKLRVLRWSVAVVIFWGEAIVKARQQGTLVFTLQVHDCPVKSITLYRAHFQKLKKVPKPTRDQLIILLPMEMGLRSGEVASLRIEHVDLENGNVMVLDSKRYKLYPIPLTFEVAKHIQELLAKDKRDEGFLILQHERVAWRRGKPITTIGLCYVWKKWAKKAGIPNWREYTPRLGRHYFAADWAYTKKGSLEVLRRIMRHKSLAFTQTYIENLIFYEDVKAEMQRLQAIPQVSESRGTHSKTSSCIHYEVCKHATEGCYCKHFMPIRKEVEHEI